MKIKWDNIHEVYNPTPIHREEMTTDESVVKESKLLKILLPQGTYNVLLLK
jgi:hypothetical protein